MNSSNRLLLQFVPQSPHDAEQLQQHLLVDGGVEEVLIESRVYSRFAVETVFAVVILGTSGLAAVARIADWLRDRNDCLLIVDTRGEDLRVEERCDIAGRRGQIIIVTSPGEQVVIEKGDAILDLQSLVSHAIDTSATTVVELARAAGAVAHIERPGLGP